MFSSEQHLGKGDYSYGWYSASGGRMHVHQERLGFTAVSIFSWSYFIEKSPFDPPKVLCEFEKPSSTQKPEMACC
jgi:hypothetical protein